MKHRAVYTVLLCLLAWAPAPGRASRAEARGAAPAPVIQAATNVEAARARGAAFAPLLGRPAEAGPPLAGKSIDRLAALQEAAAPSVAEEVAALAVGAGIPASRVWAFTLAPEVGASSMERAAGVAALITGPRSATGELLHVARWRLPATPARQAGQWIEDLTDAWPLEVMGHVGAVGALAGVNTAGLTLTVTPFATDEPPATAGLPLSCVVRDVLAHARSLDGAVERLRSAPLLGAGRFVVADGERLEGRIVERTPSKTRVRTPEGGWLTTLAATPPPDCFLGACDVDFPDLPAGERGEAGAIARRWLDAPLWLRLSTAEAVLGPAEAGDLVVRLLPATRVLEAAVGEVVLKSPGGLQALSTARLGVYAFPPHLGAEPTGDFDDPAAEFPGAVRRNITFDSPRPSGFAFNDRVPLELWLPADGEPVGVLIQLPAWKERSLFGHRALALANARKRLATAILPLPYQNGREPPGVRAGVWTLSADLARTRQAALQGLGDIAAASRILESRFGLPPSRQAIGGVSLGAHAAATALGLYPDRFAAAALVLAGGRVHEAFTRPNSVTGRIQRDLIERRVEPHEAAALVAPLEPLSVATPDRGLLVLLLAADADDVVAPERAKALAEAWGPTTRLVWLEGGHYAPARPDQALRVLDEVSSWLLKAFPAR